MTQTTYDPREARSRARPILALDGVEKAFPSGTVALRDVSLTLREGEFVSLVGPSGCGKSTVLNLMAGLSRPTAGRVRWLEPQARQNLAFVFQDAALLPWCGTRENVRLPLKLAGVPRSQAEAAVREAIALVGLQGFEAAYPRQLSGGMKMRVSIARAIATRPQVMLMDEPFGALDEITRTQLNDELLALWSRQRWTVAFVTHNLYEAVYLSSRVVVMGIEPGRIVADLPVDAPYPRTEAFRQSAEFSRYRARLADALARGMADGEFSSDFPSDSPNDSPSDAPGDRPRTGEVTA